jgi:(E)-4-hydroxy-3-methylbut-2-enyl-diphosphate synthase
MVKANEIIIGCVALGGDNNIILQSMTSTSTKDIDATYRQVIRIIEAGAHMVRITARDLEEADNIGTIKQMLLKAGHDIPLIADIHFNAKIADSAAAMIEKVRINPGNYLDKRTGKIQWTDREYREELQNIKLRLSQLVEICKAHGTAIRIGVNHGSLSERIVSKYGDTPLGMAQAALEFAQIFKELDFHKLVISLKASNVGIMVAANELYRQIAAENVLLYPLHLGVTEAGNEEDGRIKSALGIGYLLSRGIGDTIRVSLTEEPEFEIPVAQKIVKLSNENQWRAPLERVAYLRRKSNRFLDFGDQRAPLVIAKAHKYTKQTKADYIMNPENGTWESSLGTHHIDPLSFAELINPDITDPNNRYLIIDPLTCSIQKLLQLKNLSNLLLLVHKTPETPVQKIHDLFGEIQKIGLSQPVVLKIDSETEDYETFMMEAAIIAGPFLLHGQLDGLWLQSGHFDTAFASFAILQASRQRMSKTEYIACPSCGRTLFNIQEKLKEVKERTSAFAGLKIAVMGCIVNGLGEMADADYGYVGAGPGKVNIYHRHELIKKNIPQDQAADELLMLISETNKIN